MPDTKPNFICAVCYKQDVDFIVPRTEIGEALFELHFMTDHPEFYEKYLAERHPEMLEWFKEWRAKFGE